MKMKRTAEVSKTKAAAVPSLSRSPSALNVPPILLEGDAPSAPPVSGPGHRYALGPDPVTTVGEKSGEAGELPEAYGTQRLHLTARDPHWIYAHWDLTREQLKNYNALSEDRHLSLRVFKNAIIGEPATEIDVHPESRNWFVSVDQGGAKYLAELGYYSRETAQWVTISSSAPTLPPPDNLSDDVSVWFETLPPELNFDHLLQLVKAAVSEHLPLMETLQQLRMAGFSGLPAATTAPGTWTPAQERALAELVTMDAARRVWMGSLEITELIRRRFQQELFSGAAAQFSVTSPSGRAEGNKGFWFNVNAELIIYGATESDAGLTIGGRDIKLRPDGSFSFRFALPDGEYSLPVVATAPDETDQRRVELKFSRRTHCDGEVGQHPQDPELKTPLAG